MIAVQAPDRGVLFVVSGPSGVGKSTLLSRVFERVPGLSFSVSATTRPPRPGEQDGREYHFLSAEQFIQYRATGALLEWAEVYNHAYGTPRAPVEQVLQSGRSMVLDIDVRGAAQVRQALPEAVSIYLLPPDMESLRARLQARNQDGPEVIERRMRQASQQLSACGDYDYLVRNDDLDNATTILVGIFLAELHRRSRRDGWVRAWV